MERAIKRQAVAEWRDLQILNAAALINLAGIHARATFEQRLDDDALREALFNSAEWATGQIDAILGHALKVEIKAFWMGAAYDLALIDPSLSPISDALMREDALTLPSHAESQLRKALKGAETATSAQPAQQGGLAWISRFGGRVATGATGLATTATAAVNTVSPDGLKLTTRLRSAAGQRIEEAWMGQGAEPDAVLAQMIALIDEAAYSARTGLS